MYLGQHKTYPLCADWNELRLEIIARAIVSTWSEFDPALMRCGKAWMQLMQYRIQGGYWVIK